MYDKADIFNLALGALLLSRRITDTETDRSNECTVLNTHYEAAFAATLEDLDLDSTSSQVTLELIEEEPNELWLYAYRYPSDCAFLRRLQSAQVMDDRESRILLRTTMHDGEKAIYTNQQDAIAEYISRDINIGSLSAMAGLCVAYKLAVLSAPLITGKGAATLRKEIKEEYIRLKADAKEHDKNENFNYVDERLQSEYVKARLE